MSLFLGLWNSNAAAVKINKLMNDDHLKQQNNNGFIRDFWQIVCDSSTAIVDRDTDFQDNDFLFWLDCVLSEWCGFDDADEEDDSPNVLLIAGSRYLLWGWMQLTVRWGWGERITSFSFSWWMQSHDSVYWTFFSHYNVCCSGDLLVSFLWINETDPILIRGDDGLDENRQSFLLSNQEKSLISSLKLIWGLGIRI